MQSYIRPLSEGIVALRARINSALPRLNKTSVSKTVSTFRVWGSRSDLSCHQLDHTSHRAGGFLTRLASSLLLFLSSFLPGKTLDYQTLDYLSFIPTCPPLGYGQKQVPVFTCIREQHGSSTWA